MRLFIHALYDLYFYFCYELAQETSAMCSSIKPLRVHDLCHTHLLASLQWSGPSDHWMLLPTESCLQCQKWSPEKALSTPVCVKKERNGPASVNQGFSTASQGSCHLHGTLCWNPPVSHLICEWKTYLQNGLHQLITCSQSCMMSTLVISC